MSPGHEFTIFQKAASCNNTKPHHPNPNQSSSTSATIVKEEEEQQQTDNANITTCTKVWGLVTKRGTHKSPLPHGATKHFSNFMFNARSESASDKPSFRPLLQSNKSCVIALDGFFEWKKAGGKSQKKQPYFIHRSDGKPLYVAGLHTSVPTGRKTESSCGSSIEEEEERLSTFTILTTSSCTNLQWIHHRMPVILWNEEDAKRWIHKPTPQLLQELYHKSTTAAGEEEDVLMWYPVTTKMNHSQYHGEDCLDKLIIEKVPSVKSFFGSAVSTKQKQQPAAATITKQAKEEDGKKKRPYSSMTAVSSCSDDNWNTTPSSSRTTTNTFSSSPVKKQISKGNITSFFSPKKKQTNI